MLEDAVPMRTKNEVLASLKKAVECWDSDLAKSSAKEALALGISPSEAIESGLSRGMVSISQRFDDAVLFLPQLMAASDAMEEAMKVLDPVMGSNGNMGKGVVILGTVLGDVHEIGKNVIAAMLRGAGYRIIDLGRDVAIEKFVDSCRDNDADIVGASALMTTTMWGQKAIAERIKDEGLRAGTIFGGAPCTRKWVESFGGDIYCPNGAEVVELVDRLITKVRAEGGFQTDIGSNERLKEGVRWRTGNVCNVIE
jgi:trimethylamine corrinoid protein